MKNNTYNTYNNNNIYKKWIIIHMLRPVYIIIFIIKQYNKINTNYITLLKSIEENYDRTSCKFKILKYIKDYFEIMIK